MMQLPKGFEHKSFDLLLIHFAQTLPMLGPMLYEHLGMTEAEALPLIRALEAKGLAQFAVSPYKEPSVFIGPPASFTTPNDREFAVRLVSFWDAQGEFDERNGKIKSAETWVIRVHTPDGEIAVVESVAKKLRKLGLLTVDEKGQWHGSSQAEVIKWTEQHGVCDFCSDPTPLYVEQVKSFEFMAGYTSEGGWATCETCHQLVMDNNRTGLLTRGVKSSRLGGKLGAQAQTELHRRFWLAMDALKLQPKLPPSKQPHWQEALDRKMQAIDKLKFVERGMRGMPETQIKADVLEDLRVLKFAEVYSFNADTIHAIQTGAQSLPHEATLESVEVPTTMAGWFWFAEPLSIACSPISSDTTAALLWSWDTTEKIPTIRFSAYVINERYNGEPVGEIAPSTKWVWPVSFSFHQMIGLNTMLYRETYGPKGPYRDQPNLIGEAGTMKCVADLSLFFLMSCLWFRQTIPGTKKKIEPTLTQEQPHVERHLRRRHEREHNLKPVVRVIALRKTAATLVEPTEGEKKHHLTVRFVVSGHPRWQPCGPGRKEKKLIWIAPYPKGNPDHPFKESGPKVYAVVR